ncbi:MAG: MFS transporter [Bacillota bacterium]|nr:MFS transporter [Bacillota bacterium]
MKNTKIVPNYFDNALIKPMHLRLIFLVAIAYFFDIADNYNFSFVAPILIKSWGLSLTQVGQINSVFFIGMFVGGLLGGFISDKLGRKKGFIISIFIFSIFSIINGLAPNFVTFIMGRFFTGIGVASLVIVSTPYLLEMLPKDSRGKWQAIAVGAGCAAIPVIGIIVKVITHVGPNAWRIVYFIGGLGLITAVLGIFWLRESPRWLVSKGRAAEAEKIVEEIAGQKLDLTSSIVKEVAVTKINKNIKDIVSRKNIKNTLVLLSIFTIAYPAAFIFINWAPTLFSTKGYSLQDTSLLTLFISFGMVAGPFFASLISDRFGRKVSIVVVFMIAAVLSVVYADLQAKAVIIAVAVIIAMMLQANSPLTLAYLGELYPTNIRSTAVGIVYSLGRLGIALVSAIVPIVNTKYGYMGVFSLMGILLLVSSTITGIWGVHTFGKSLEELNDTLQDSQVKIYG